MILEPKSFQLFPESASNFAPQVDGLYLYMVVVSAFFSLLVAFLIIFFAVKYRKRPGAPVPAPINDHSIGSMILEIAWSVIPLGLSLVMFAWGASIMFSESRPPKDALNIYVTGKRWMWKVQHLEGAREINELHVPVNRDIRLTLTSEDVIHDFYVPDFRTKTDVLPGRYTTEWFRPTKIGVYHIFCAEYCGTKHSGMIGWVHVLSAEDYDKWLAQGSGEGSMAEEGESLFRQLGCAQCHVKDGHGRAPNLSGAFGTKVDLSDGTSVRIDESYIRESVLYPQAKIVAGYDRIMPTFKGLISDEGMLKLIEYIKSLGDPNGVIPEKNLPLESPDLQKTGPMALPASEMPKTPAKAPRSRFGYGEPGDRETTMITAPPPVKEPITYLNAETGIKSWLLTKDHKRIAIMYLIVVTAFFALGGIFAGLIRLELTTPAGDLFESNTYNKVFTMHGILMVFFFLIPSIPATLGNFLIPMMIGAKDLAFPRINLLSWYIYMLGGIFTLYVLITGGVDTGWTFYTPFSSSYSNGYVVAAGLGIFINGFSAILTGLNFIVTIHRMRAPGLTWFRLPLFVWAHYATSAIMILGTPVIAVTLFLLVLERGLHIGFFDPAYGGDPVLFQHLFWFYSHPAVYIMILPSMGVISEVISTFSSKKPFGYTFIAFSSIAIAVFGFLVWGHHLFVAGQSIYAGLVFSVLSYIVAIPSAIKVFNWAATMYKGQVRMETPMLYAIGFIGLFTIGGLTGVVLASLGMDVHLTDTYFVIAHFHYVMVGGALLGYLSGLHFWWPKMFGRMYSDVWSKVSAVLVFAGFNLTFGPQFLLGYMGMPRRYHVYPPEFQVFNVLSSAGASVLGLGLLLPAIYLTWSLKFGERAPANPWGATGLEWQTTSPPIPENFEVTPVVTTEAYDYSTVQEVVHIG